MSPEKNEFIVIINARSGTALREGQEKIEREIVQSCLNVKSLYFLEADDFQRKIRSVMTSRYPVLIGGGDGTISKTAPLFLKAQKPFGLIPLGTMNLLARDLDLPLDLPTLLKSYADGTQQIQVDVGMVNDLPFLCCAALGAMPDATEFREKHRDDPDIFLMPRLTMFVMDRLDWRKSRHLHMTLDGKTRGVSTSSFVVSNNQYALKEGEQTSGFHKESLQDGILGVYTATPHGFWERVRLLLRLGTGSWKKDPSIHEDSARTVHLVTDRKKEIVALDGENVELHTPLNFYIGKQHLKVMVPEYREEIRKAANA